MGPSTLRFPGLCLLARLQELDLRGDRVRDVTPFGALRELRVLGLAETPFRSQWATTEIASAPPTFSK